VHDLGRDDVVTPDVEVDLRSEVVPVSTGVGRRLPRLRRRQPGGLGEPPFAGDALGVVAGSHLTQQGDQLIEGIRASCSSVVIPAAVR
jgi:hypothetical protein